jgi:hypothetical protein
LDPKICWELSFIRAQSATTNRYSEARGGGHGRSHQGI